MPANADSSPVSRELREVFHIESTSAATPWPPGSPAPGASKRDKMVGDHWSGARPVTAVGLTPLDPTVRSPDETFMLTDTLYRHPRQFGVQVLQQRGEQGARELSTRRLRLDAGTSATFSLADEETVVILQQGRGTFAAGGQPGR